MAKGQKIAQGTVEEIVGTGGAVLIGLADAADADRAAAVLAGAARRRHGRAHRRGAGRRPRTAPAGRGAAGAGDRRDRGRPVHPAPSAGGRVPGTGGGAHDRDCDTAEVAGSGTCRPTGAVAGYRPERTLRLSVELRRQFKRRRTIGVFLLMAALPLILIGALHLGGGDEAQANSRINLVDVATASGLNFTLFVLFATTGFFLVVVFALFFGDTVASEARGGRCATRWPPRCRACGCSGRSGTPRWSCRSARCSPLVVVSVVAGGIAYGFDDVQTPVGSRSAQGDGVLRLAGMVGYLAVHLLVVGALAFWLSTITDAPLAAVGGAVFTMFVFAILDQVDAARRHPQLVPVGRRFAWTDLLQTPVDSERPVPRRHPVAGLRRGPHGAGFRHFGRRDVTS